MRVYLLQRLDPPMKRSNGPLGKAHRVFGGGMLGLSEKAWDILDQIWDIHYMGAAEFEWGALPKCLSRMAESFSDLVFFDFVVPGEKIKKSWKLSKTTVIVDATVYVICQQQKIEQVKRAIIDEAKGKHNLHDLSLFNEVLQKDFLEADEQRHLRTCGWIDIQNDYMFFTDKGMYDDTKALFGLDE